MSATTYDLTSQEQHHVRVALRFLHVKFGTWATLGKAIRFKDTTLANVAGGHKAVSPMMLVRVARLVKVGLDDLLAGKYPPKGMCPLCGHGPQGESVAPSPSLQAEGVQ
jgi:hypothetical protein